jgi:hypothetical protein
MHHSSIISESYVMFSSNCYVTKTTLCVNNCYFNSYFLYTPITMSSNTQWVEAATEKGSQWYWISYHIYSVGIDCNRLDSHQDHPDSHDSHHTLFQVAGNDLMGTKVHCTLVLEQNPLLHLEQYEILIQNAIRIISLNILENIEIHHTRTRNAGKSLEYLLFFKCFNQCDTSKN